MTFQQLIYIVEISKCGSINKAAQNLFLSQSSISSAVKELELELGISILNRNNRGVEFTSEGKEFLSYANSLLEKKQFIEDLYVKDDREQSSEKLSVSSQHYPFVIDAFIRTINKFKHVDYQFQAKTSSMEHVIEDVYYNRSDIGVIFYSNATKRVIGRILKAKNMEFQELLITLPCIFISRSHPLADKKDVILKELAGYPFLTFDLDQGENSDLCEEVVHINQSPNQIIKVNDHTAATDIIVGTNAYTTGSGLLTKGFSHPKLVTIPIRDCEKMHIGWIHREDYAVNKTSRKFIELLQQAIQDALTYTNKRHTKA